MTPEIKLKIPNSLFKRIVTDLRREHSHAHERVGFVFGKTKELTENQFTIYLNEYSPVDDVNYIEDNSVGARINSNAITKAMQIAFAGGKGSFHTHLHDFEFEDTMPQFSIVDMDELPPLAKSASNFVPGEAHGLLLLSGNSLNALISLDGYEKLITPKQITVVGYPLSFSFPKEPLILEAIERYERQSFLGPLSQATISRLKIGVVGLSGGGSHIVQQLAHIGFKKYVLLDDDIVSESNLNRLVGATLTDVKLKASKFSVADRLIKSLIPKAEIEGGKYLWQNMAHLLQDCDVVFGCVDTFASRRDIESECRRFLIPYIDIGMDVMKVDKDPYNMFGQVQLSIPGEPCLICRGFLSEENLAREANRYGDAGDRPQVVWANGVLASTAVGVLIDLITNWTGMKDRQVYLSYEGNLGLVSNHIKLQYSLPTACEHYKISDVGPVRL